jgi:predicted nucleic acid-binding protein
LAELDAIAYVDSSALIKLIVPEAESEALRHELEGWGRHASSAIARTEVVRAAARVDPAAREPARRLLETVSLIAVSDQILDRAASLAPASLRSLDALHLASALALGPALGSVITYDVRLGDAARATGADVRAPS